MAALNILHFFTGVNPTRGGINRVEPRPHKICKLCSYVDFVWYLFCFLTTAWNILICLCPSMLKPDIPPAHIPDTWISKDTSTKCTLESTIKKFWSVIGHTSCQAKKWVSMLSQFKAALDENWPSNNKVKCQWILPSKSVVCTSCLVAKGHDLWPKRLMAPQWWSIFEQVAVLALFYSSSSVPCCIMLPCLSYVVIQWFWSKPSLWINFLCV